MAERCEEPGDIESGGCYRGPEPHMQEEHLWFWEEIGGQWKGSRKPPEGP